MAYATKGVFTLTSSASSTIDDPFRFIFVNSDGQADYPNASTDAEVLAIVGVTEDAITDAGDLPVRGFDGGVHKVAVEASQVVAAGDDLYLTGTAGCVQTGSTGWLVGTALTGATSGASELAVISAVLHFPVEIISGT